MAETDPTNVHASVFWGGITVGRLLAVPLAVRFSADLLVRVNLVGSFLSSVLLWLLGRVSNKCGGMKWGAHHKKKKQPINR